MQLLMHLRLLCDYRIAFVEEDAADDWLLQSSQRNFMHTLLGVSARCAVLVVSFLCDRDWHVGWARVS